MVTAGLTAGRASCCLTSCLRESFDAAFVMPAVKESAVWVLFSVPVGFAGAMLAEVLLLKNDFLITVGEGLGLGPGL